MYAVHREYMIGVIVMGIYRVFIVVQPVLQVLYKYYFTQSSLQLTEGSSAPLLILWIRKQS